LTTDELLDHLLATLRRIPRLLPEDREAWLADEVAQLAVERLWILAGELAGRYAESEGLPSGVGPWAELHRLRSRLAHALPGEISAVRLWDESHDDLHRVLALASEARGA
jgi:uncharacterized protein with HEPN domain